MCVHTYITARTFTQLLYELAAKCTLCCTALTNCAYVQFEVYTHCSAVIFHSVLEHIRTFHASWCSCPPLSQDRWWWEGGQCVQGWWMGWLLLSHSQWTTTQPALPPHHHTDTWGWCCQFYTHKGQLGGSEWGPLNLHKQLHEHQLD